MKSFALWTLLAVLLLGLAGCGAKPEQKTWDEYGATYTFNNDTVELVVSPHTGRIVRYGYVGGPNLLWENREPLAKHDPDAGPDGDRASFGPLEFRERVEHALTGQTWEAFREGRTLRLISPPLTGLQVRLVREISLAGSGTEVTIVTRLLDARAQPAPGPVWQITALTVPDVVLARLVPEVSGRGWRPVDGSMAWPTLKRIETVLAFKRAPGMAARTAVDADLLAGLFGSTLFIQRRVPQRPDEPAGQTQLYSDPDQSPVRNFNVPPFITFEHAAPTGTKLVEVWSLEKLADPEDRTPDALVKRLLNMR